MTTVYDVPPDLLIKSIAEQLKTNEHIKRPEWAEYVKTGMHREKPPEQEDWWETRTAAIFRKVYIKGPIGIERLSAEYGGARNYGSKPEHAVKGSRSIVRECVQQLEDAGLLKRNKNQGRVCTPKGVSILDNLSHRVMAELLADNPNLNKY